MEPPGAAGASAGSAAVAGTQGGDAGQAAPMQSGCDRPCLIEVLSTYLAALTKKDPSSLKLADDVRFTENGAQLKVGEGLWRTATAVRENTRLDFADPVEGQVGSQLVLESGSSAVAFNIRIKVEDGLIREIESMAPGTSAPATTLAGMIPDPLFKQAIPPAERMTRQDMLEAAQAYEKLLETGSFRMSGAKFHADMVRLENGTETGDAASLSAREGGVARGDIPSRYAIIDEEYGMVFAVYQFAPILVPFELFKIMNGEIRLLNIVINGQADDGWD
jgi:hypothetical protein